MPEWLVVPAKAIAKSDEVPLSAVPAVENVIAPVEALLIVFNSARV